MLSELLCIVGEMICINRDNKHLRVETARYQYAQLDCYPEK